MIKLFKNANVYAPEPLGMMDILLSGGKIAAMAPQITGYENAAEVTVIDLEGRLTVPGLIDIHVHITGGGGEVGPRSRVPELQLSQITTCGVTTVLGLYGTDGLTRGQEALITKSRALTEEGITCYCLSGAYRFPPPSLLGDITRDIAFIDPVVGVKTALADHRGSNPSLQELIRLGSDARLGGILSGKPGLVVTHLGSSPEGMDLIFQVLEHSQIPANTFLPTHCERNETLFQQAIRYTQMGGTADFTADLDGTKGGSAQILARLVKEGVDPRFLTLSSDSGGSLPRFDAEDNCIGMDVGSPTSLLLELRRLVTEQGMALETALLFLTENPARVLGKSGVKGRLTPGADADILVLGPDMTVEELFAGGRDMVRQGQPVALGYFEQADSF